MNAATLKKTVALIIPIYNGLELTKTCLNNLYTIFKSMPSGFIEYLPVIIDDGSTDSTKQWIENNYPNCTVLQGDGNLWWSGAVNMGAKYAIEKLNASHILLWNNDIHVTIDYFKLLTYILTGIDENIIIGSKIYADLQYRKIWSFGGKFNPYTGRKFMIGHSDDDSEKYQQIIEVDWLTGMGTLIPKEIVEKIGYWDAKRFPQYYGDSDFTYRAKLSGYKIFIYPQLRIVNDISNSGIKQVLHWREIIPTLTSIKSIHHIGKNFMFYRLYSRSPLAYLRFLEIYIYFFGGIIKRKIRNQLRKMLA
jgi:GT2 family glycosyltransferase